MSNRRTLTVVIYRSYVQRQLSLLFYLEYLHIYFHNLFLSANIYSTIFYDAAINYDLEVRLYVYLSFC